MFEFKKSTYIKLGLLSCLTLTSSAQAITLAARGAAPAVTDAVVMNGDCATCRDAQANTVKADETKFKSFTMDGDFMRQLTGAPDLMRAPKAELDEFGEIITPAEIAAEKGMFFDRRNQNVRSKMRIPRQLPAGFRDGGFELPGSIVNENMSDWTEPSYRAAARAIAEIPQAPQVPFATMHKFYMESQDAGRWALSRKGREALKAKPPAVEVPRYQADPYSRLLVRERNDGLLVHRKDLVQVL